MDLEALTLLKVMLVAGLAWISMCKVRRMQTRQREIQDRQKWELLQDMSIIQTIKRKGESSLSTSVASKPDINYEDYSNIYDKFWAEDNLNQDHDNRIDIEEPQPGKRADEQLPQQQSNTSIKEPIQCPQTQQLLVDHHRVSCQNQSTSHKKASTKPDRLFDRSKPRASLLRCRLSCRKKGSTSKKAIVKMLKPRSRLHRIKEQSCDQ